MNANELVEFHWKAIGRYDTYITTTNAKAAFLIAWNTFAIGTLALKWNELLSPLSALPKTSAWASACLLIALLSALASLWETFRVVNPFLDSPQRPLKYQSLVFFRHVAEFASDAEFHAAVTTRTLDELVFDLAAQAHTLARALAFKFATLRRAIGFVLCLQLPAVLLFITTVLIVHLNRT